jgi:hypothetical protein
MDIRFGVVAHLLHFARVDNEADPVYRDGRLADVGGYDTLPNAVWWIVEDL